MPFALVEFRRWCSFGVVLCLRVDAGCRIGLLAYGAMQIDSGVKVSGNDDVIVAFNTRDLVLSGQHEPILRCLYRASRVKMVAGWVGICRE